MRWLPGALATPHRQQPAGASLRAGPVTAGLAYLFSAPRGDIDAVRDRPPVGGTRVFGAGREGQVFAGNGSSRVIDVGALGGFATLTGGATLMAVVEFSATSVATSTICSFVDGSGVRSVSMHANDATNSNLVAGGYNNASSWTGYVTPNGLVAGRRYVMIATYNTSTTLQTFEVNDVGTTTAAITFALGDACSIGARRTAPSTYNSYFNGNIYAVGLWTRQLERRERAALAQNPWSLFATQPRALWSPQASSVTVYRPGSDIIVNGWTPVGAASLAAAMSNASTADYALSPNLTDPTTQAWDSPLPAGTWDITVGGARTGASGQVRIVCLDSGGTPVGTSAWQALTGTDADYTLSVTTTATAPNFRIEVQA